MNDPDDFLPAPTQGGDVAPYAPGGTEWLPASAPAGTDHVPDFSHSHGAAPVRVFGQQLAPGATPQAAQRDLDALTNHFAQTMRQQRIAAAYIDTAVAWFRHAAAAAVPHEWPAHGYDLRAFAFTREDEPYITSFANAAHRGRVPQAVVLRALAWYVELCQRLQQARQPQQQRQASYGATLDDLSDAEYEAVLRRAPADRRAAMDGLMTAWGHEFEPRLRVVKAFFAGLPAGERDYLESAVVQGTHGATLAGNSAGFIDQMYRHAIGQMPTGAALQQEIASLEACMRTDRRAWNRDERAQLRLRELYRQRDGE